MNEEIKIQAEITSDDACQFSVDRPVYPDGSVYFSNPKEAAGSPLAEQIFGIPGISGILISGETVKVSRQGGGDWLPAAKQIGAMIRSQILSGEAAVSAEHRKNLPTEDVLRKRIQELLINEINPAVASHGGFVRLIDVKKNNIYLQLGGGCQGCGMANVTLRQGIEKLIRNQIPEVGNILDVTDHQSGANPYY